MRLSKTPFVFPVQPKKSQQQQSVTARCARFAAIAAVVLTIAAFASYTRPLQQLPMQESVLGAPFQVPNQQSPAAKDLLSSGSSCSRQSQLKPAFKTAVPGGKVYGALRPAQQPADKATIWRRPVILLLGDSLTELGQDEGGWAVKLAATYKRKVDVLNRGFAGFNTAITLFGLNEITEQISQQQTVIATVWLGANDAAISSRRDGRAYVPLDQYAVNLISIIKKLKEAGAQNIILMTPPPVFEGAPQAVDPGQAPARTYNTTRPYAAVVRAVGSSQQVLLLDIWQQFESQKGWQQQLLEPDGLHLSAGGHWQVYQALMQLIEERLPELRPSAMPMHHPHWTMVYDKTKDTFAAEEAAYQQDFSLE